MLTATPFTDLSAQMTGRVVAPSDPDWDATRQVFNLATDLRPAAVALPRDVDDVTVAVEYAGANGLRVAPQATGHNADALGSLEDALLVDVRELQDVSIDPGARRVRVGAGVKWAQVVPQLSELGLAALHGSSPDVGIAGYSLGGGMGWLARKYGLQTNSVTSLELVTADGRATRVDAEHEPELFWALRGGNGNFGVVTAIEFAVYPVENLYAGVMFFPFERAGEVLHAWTELLPTLPDELMTWAKLLQFPDAPDVPEPVRGASFTVIFGAFLGSEREGQSLLRPVQDLGPAMDTFAVVPPAALGEMAMDPPEPLPFVSSTALLSDLPSAGVDELVSAAGPGPHRPWRWSSCATWAAPWRAGRRTPARGRPSPAHSPCCRSAWRRTRPRRRRRGPTSSRSIEPSSPTARGDYANFVMEPTDASRFFDADTWARLRRIKALYDPSDLLRATTTSHPRT